MYPIILGLVFIGVSPLPACPYWTVFSQIPEVLSDQFCAVMFFQTPFTHYICSSCPAGICKKNDQNQCRNKGGVQFLHKKIQANAAAATSYRRPPNMTIQRGVPWWDGLAILCICHYVDLTSLNNQKQRKQVNRNKNRRQDTATPLGAFMCCLLNLSTCCAQLFSTLFFCLFASGHDTFFTVLRTNTA